MGGLRLRIRRRYSSTALTVRRPPWPFLTVVVVVVVSGDSHRLVAVSGPGRKGLLLQWSWENSSKLLQPSWHQ